MADYCLDGDSELEVSVTDEFEDYCNVKHETCSWIE